MEVNQSNLETLKYWESNASGLKIDGLPIGVEIANDLLEVAHKKRDSLAGYEKLQKKLPFELLALVVGLIFCVKTFNLISIVPLLVSLAITTCLVIGILIDLKKMQQISSSKLPPLYENMLANPAMEFAFSVWRIHDTYTKQLERFISILGALTTEGSDFEQYRVPFLMNASLQPQVWRETHEKALRVFSNFQALANKVVRPEAIKESLSREIGQLNRSLDATSRAVDHFFNEVLVTKS